MLKLEFFPSIFWLFYYIFLRQNSGNFRWKHLLSQINWVSDDAIRYHHTGTLFRYIVLMFFTFSLLDLYRWLAWKQIRRKTNIKWSCSVWLSQFCAPFHTRVSGDNEVLYFVVRQTHSLKFKTVFFLFKICPGTCCWFLNTTAKSYIVGEL